MIAGPTTAQEPAPKAAPAAPAPTPPGLDAAASRARHADLIRSGPFDRLTLTDNTVIETEPLSPRPLPVPDTRKAGKTQAELEEMARKERERREHRAPDDPEESVVVHLLEGEPRDFRVRRASIRAVEYYEDMLIADADRLVEAGQYARAFERLLLVRTRDAGWKGLDDAVNRLLFAEGGATLLEDDGRGLRLLTALLARKPDYPGLVERLATAFARKIDQAIGASNFFGGRLLLRQMTAVAATHPATAAARGKFVALARAQVERAAQADPDARLDRLREANRIWPELEGLERLYGEAFRAAPAVRVAVVDVPDPAGPFPRSPAAERVGRLLYLPTLAVDDESALRGEPPGQLLASWKLGELGAAWQVGIRPGFRWSDGSRPVSAVDLARSLADRASTASPGYNARWADLLDKVTILDDDRIEVRLVRPTARPETWLLDPVGPAHAAADGWVSAVGGGRAPVGDGPYAWRSADGDAGTATYAASTAAPADLAPKLRRVVEVRAASPLPQADRMARGEVDVIEHASPADVAALGRLGDVRVGTYRTPSVHRLALDGRNPALANRRLRRALSLAVDRATLLRDDVLGRAPAAPEQALSAPFVRGSFVADPDVPPLDYNPVLAKGLVTAATKELGGKPIKLTLEYPPLPEARAAAPKLSELFRAVGLEVVPVERPESALEAELRSGRRFDLAYRACRPDDPIRDAGPMLVPGYDAPPSAGAFASAASPRILQLLIELDRAPDPQSARRLAVQVDRESRDELPVIPLWQLQDRYAWRGNVRGLPDSTDHLYRNAHDWEADPWLAKAP